MFNLETLPLPESRDNAAPFGIYVRHLDKKPNGTWRPAALMTFSHGLRDSGFLDAVPAEELKTLLGLLSFVTPNGTVAPSLDQVAAAFHLPRGKVERLLGRLIELSWRGQPLLIAHRHESGMITYAPPLGFLPVEEETDSNWEGGYARPYLAAPREAIVAFTREHYARPRAEVEAIIEEQLGYKKSVGSTKSEPEIVPPTPEDEAQMALRTRLLSAGLRRDQAEALLRQFDGECIARQLDWLPFRNARNPAGLLIKAIKGDYEAPVVLRVLPHSAESALEATPKNALEAALINLDLPDGDIPHGDMTDGDSTEDFAESSFADVGFSESDLLLNDDTDHIDTDHP